MLDFNESMQHKQEVDFDLIFMVLLWRLPVASADTSFSFSLDEAGLAGRARVVCW